MKIALKHLLPFLKQQPCIEEISEKLFQLGHENEIVNSKIFDLELTPNRGDCFSVLGLARDLGSFYELQDNLKFFNGKIDELKIDFENKSKAFCPKISFLEIEIESIPEKYNEDLSSYFKDLEINRNNFFTDVSNYISYLHLHIQQTLQNYRDLGFESADYNFLFLLRLQQVLI